MQKELKKIGTFNVKCSWCNLEKGAKLNYEQRNK